MPRPAKIEIDLAAVKHNFGLVSRAAPNSRVVAVVKANAYGHGATEIAEALRHCAAVFAVSCIEEAIALRECGIKQDILLLEGCFTADELTLVSRHRFDLVCHCHTQLEALLSRTFAHPVRVWLKVDTGMHRLGFQPQQVAAIFARLAHCSWIAEPPILMTHLASADQLGNVHTLAQLRRFNDLQQALQRKFGGAIATSVGNSATILGWSAGSDWVRPGLMLYGLSPFADTSSASANCVSWIRSLRPVMRFTSQIIAVREIARGEAVGYGCTWQAQQPTRVATVAIGYGDGYPRGAKAGTPVLIKGQRACVIGRVSMDMITVDVTHLAGVELGDEVELWGQALSANEVATWANTISYELVTRVSSRVAVVYRE